MGPQSPMLPAAPDCRPGSPPGADYEPGRRPGNLMKHEFASKEVELGNLREHGQPSLLTDPARRVLAQSERPVNIDDVAIASVWRIWVNRVFRGGDTLPRTNSGLTGKLGFLGLGDPRSNAPGAASRGLWNTLIH